MKNLAYKLMFVCFAFLLVPFGIADEEDESIDTIKEDFETTFEATLENLVESVNFFGFPINEEQKAESIEEAMRKYHEVMDNPEVAFEQQLKQLETFIPELSGISSTWETKEKPTLFAELTIAIARHHKSNNKQIARLKTTTQRLIDTGPAELLSVDMHFFTKLLVSRVQSIHEDLL